MPIKIPERLPATEVLEKENIFVMTENRALHQDIRPLNILIFNLMPTKIVTETQLLRKLSNTPLQVNAEFLQTASYTSQHTDAGHLDSFYRTFDEVKSRKYDGMIVTGAPLENFRYEEVAYWEELCRILDWTEDHVHCVFYLCWGAYAALYYFYGIDNYRLPKKLSGVYPHRILKKTSPLFRGFDDIFYAPQSRGISVHLEDIQKVSERELMAVSDIAGFTIAKTTDSRKFFVTCHTEYDSDTLMLEYLRDTEKGLNPDIPENYFPGDDPTKAPVVNWRSSGQLLYTNWLNYYVYQSTPYNLDQIGEDPGINFGMYI